MFLNFYNFLRGYLTMAVTGFSVARFINMAVHRGIYLWDVRSVEGHTQFRVSIKGFRLLHHCARKSGCRLKIVEKFGLPFVLNRYRGRKFLVIGLLLFVGLIWYLTTFMWLVSVSGNNRIETEAILSRMAALGVSVGERKSGLDPREIEEALMLSFPTLAFANLQIRGTHARLEVVETIQNREAEDTGPGDVIAAKDGIIVQIATEAGRPLFQPGDVVQAGDVLVSGEIRVGEDGNYTSYFVRASSKVTAKRFYEYIFDVPLTYIIKSFTGNLMRNYGIILFDQKIYLRNLSSPFENYEIRTDENRLNFGADYPLPAAFFTETFKEFTPITAQRSVEEGLIMAQTIIASRLARELMGDSEVLETEITYEQREDVLTITARVEVVEIIGIQRPLPIKPAAPAGEPANEDE